MRFEEEGDDLNRAERTILKRCPFCDGIAHRVHAPAAGRAVVCGSCGAQTDYYNAAEEAEAAWNRRATEEKP